MRTFLEYLGNILPKHRLIVRISGLLVCRTYGYSRPTGKQTKRSVTSGSAFLVGAKRSITFTASNWPWGAPLGPPSHRQDYIAGGQSEPISRSSHFLKRANANRRSATAEDIFYSLQIFGTVSPLQSEGGVSKGDP